MRGREGQRRRRNPLGRLLKGFCGTLSVLLLLFFIIIMAGGGPLTIRDSSMSPALSAGDKAVELKLSYLLLSPKRGDLVELSADSDGQKSYVRRIIGLPGETIQISGGYVYINGNRLDESAYASGPASYSGTAASPMTLSEDQYFVMSDMRSDNFDSRDPTLGNISKADIVGKLFLRVAPFSKFGLLR